MKKMTWETVNELAAKYATQYGTNIYTMTSHKQQDTFNELYTAVLRIYRPYNPEGPTIDASEVVSKFFAERGFRNFDPARGKFGSYFKRCADSILNDFRDFYNGKSKKGKEKQENDSAESAERAEFLNKKIQKEYWHLVPFNDEQDENEDQTAEKAYVDIEAEDKMAEIIAIALTIADRLHGKAHNSARIMNFRNFFTEEVTAMVQQENLANILQPHERNLFQAMRPAFLNFFMSAPCPSVRAIANTPRRRYGELVEGEEMRVCPLPLPGKVHVAYWADVEKQKVTQANISQMKKAYFSFFKEQLEKTEQMD